MVPWLQVLKCSLPWCCGQLSNATQGRADAEGRGEVGGTPKANKSDEAFVAACASASIGHRLSLKHPVKSGEHLKLICPLALNDFARTSAARGGVVRTSRQTAVPTSKYLSCPSLHKM